MVLSIQGRQRYGEQEPETIELVTGGTMEFRDGGWDITYEESELTGLAGVVTTFRVDGAYTDHRRPDGVTFTRSIREGVSHESLYQMEFGTLMITVKATNVFYDIVPDGGTIDLTYQIVIENTEAGMIDYHLDIRAK